ncbi:MAG: hypothetical protein ACO1PB_02105 [Ramlibacter sp.]
MNALAVSTFRSCLAAAVLAAGGWLAAPAAAQPGAGAASNSERNVYAAGGQVRPAAEVKGDFTAAGGKVVVDQPIAGDAMLAGGSVDVRAPVGDDVRAGGGDVSIESTVGGELFATGANITLTPAAVVARGATLYGSSVEIGGRVAGDLRATAARITIDGEVGGKAHLVADEIVLGPKARIGGALTYVSPSELRRAEGATIVGAVTREQGPSQRPGAMRERHWERSMTAPSWGGGILSFLAFLAAGALFLLLLPRFGATASGRIRSSPWPALGIGFATAVATPVLAVLLFITVLGIPLGIALLALYPALLLAGFLVGVLFIGELLAAAVRKDAPPRSYAAKVGWFAAALLLTLLLARVPFVGGVLVALLALAGIGACVLELYLRRQGPGAGGAAATPLPAAAVQAG